MSKVKKELEAKILKHIFDNTSLDWKIKVAVEDGIDEAIDYSSDDADHKNPTPASDSGEVWKFKAQPFPPLDEFTKLRRRVFKKLGADMQDKRDALKEEAIELTDVNKSLDGKKIVFTITNKSRLLAYLRSGKTGETTSKDRDQLEAERRWVFLTSKEKNMFFDKEIQTYMKILLDLKDGHGVMGKIPIRDVLHASAEKIGKDFIRKNII